MNKHLPSDEPKSIESVERIIETAARLYAQHPMEALSVDMIAKEAGVKAPLIIYHFKSKANLYRVVFERLMALQEQFTRPYHDLWLTQKNFIPQEAAEILKKIIEFMIEGIYGPASENSLREKMIIIEHLYPSIYYERFYNEYFKRHYELITSIIMAITGNKDRETAYFQATTIFGQMTGFLVEKELLSRLGVIRGFNKKDIIRIKSLVLRNTFLILGYNAPEINIPIDYGETYRPLEVSDSLMENEADFHEPDYSVETVSRIIESAMKFFTRFHSEMVSLRTIAKELHVRPDAILYHFKSKANLYRIVIERAITHHVDRIRRHYSMVEKNQTFSRPQAAQLLCEWISFIMDGIYDDEHPEAWKDRVFMHEILFPSSYYTRYYNMFFRKNYELLAAIVMGITGRKNRNEAFLQVTTIFGQMISFWLERQMLIRSLGITGYSREELDKIKSLVISQAFLVLES